MLTVEEALVLIKMHMPTWGKSSAHLSETHFGLTTYDLVADRDYPPYHRVMMDGIAISSKAYDEGLRTFKIAGICAAGVEENELQDPSTCFEVMTGAPLPRNADLVIPYEDLLIENNQARINVEVARKPMSYVHLKRSDARAGDVLLRAGARLNGPHWGIASSVGQASLEVTSMPKVNIISTGDELVPTEQVPLSHQIRQSNVHALKASLTLHGYKEIDISHLSDDPDAIRAHYLEGRSNYQLMIYSGGVSKGKFDYLPSVWKELGVTEIFHGVSQRPGKPLWFGVDKEHGNAVLGLPGNPVSSLVCLHRYLLSKKDIYVQLTKDLRLNGNLTFFVPVKLEYEKSGLIKAIPNQLKNSGEFSGLAETDGFIELPKGQDVYKTGETYLFHPWMPQ